MTFKPLTREDYQQAIDLVAKWGNITEAARQSNLSRSAIDNRMQRGRALYPDMVPAPPKPTAPAAETISFDPLPPADLPFSDRLLMHADRNAVRINHAKASAMQTVRIPIDGPYAIAWVGDPHMDDPYCDLTRLMRDAETIAKTPAMYGANGGDSINNWVGKLERLYAEQSVTATEAWEMVEWLLKGSGINWLVWILGNHDVWNFGARYFAALNTRRILMRDWDARFNIVSPCGGICRVWARHDFKGTSIWNEMHGLKRAAMQKGEADILAAFHRHTFGMQQTQLSNGEIVMLIRAKGYKEVDHYATLNGFAQGDIGHTVVTVIEPRPEGQPIVHGFNNVQTGAAFLTSLRAERGYK